MNPLVTHNLSSSTNSTTSPVPSFNPCFQQQYDTYGEPIYVQRTLPLGLTEETTTTTTTTRKEEIERKRKKKEEDERRRKRKEEEDRQRIQQENAQAAYDPCKGKRRLLKVL